MILAIELAVVVLLSSCGFRKTKLPVQTASSPSNGSCLVTNHFLRGREDEVGAQAYWHSRQAVAQGTWGLGLHRMPLSFHRTSTSKEWEHVEAGQEVHVSQRVWARHTVPPFRRASKLAWCHDAQSPVGWAP